MSKIYDLIPPVLRWDELDLAYTCDGVHFYTWQDVPFSGIAVEIFPDDTLAEDYFLFGRQHGISRSWYPNGQIRCEGFYVDHKKHGLWLEWDEAGTLRCWTEYAWDGLVQQTTFDASGNETEYRLHDGITGDARRPEVVRQMRRVPTYLNPFLPEGFRP